MHRITIFGDIGTTVTPDGVKAQLAAVPPGDPITVEINSDGGNVGDGTAIYNLLRTWAGRIEVEIVGWALSIATVIAMAGKKIRAHETSLIMVHAPWVGGGSGNAAQLRELAGMLDQVAQAMRQAYARTQQPASVIDGWLDGTDHWMTAQEALAVGLIDEIIPSASRAASRIDVQACRFPVPPALQQRIYAMGTPTLPDAAAAAAHAAGAQAEARRRADVRARFAAYTHREGIADLLRQCEDDVTCTPEAAGQRILARLALGATPAAAHYTPSDPGGPAGDPRMETFIAAASDVLLARGGIKVAEPHPAARDLGRVGIVGMAERILRMRDIPVADKSRDQIIKAALSTSDFPALLAAVTGRSLRNGYEVAPATFAGWTGERTVQDFRQQSLVALSEAPALLKVADGAEYKQGKLDDSNSTFKADTYGRLIPITRHTLINDDLDAFTSLPKAMGAAARRLEADMVYAALTANANLGDGNPLFHLASHGNLQAAGAPDLATLGIMRAAMRKQKGLQGLGYLDPQPRYLIAPVALETHCEQLLASLVDPSKSNSTPNVEWVRGLELVCDPRLDLDSATKWYLAAAPEQIDGIVRAYVDGQERPFLEESTEFATDAVTFKVRLDLAVGVIDYRALQRNG